MQNTYTSRALRAHGNPDALVLHCSDHRFQMAFHEFLADGLRLSSYALISVPGGGHLFSLMQVLPKFAKSGAQSVAFHVKRARPGRLVLIAHEDCLFFKEKVEFFFTEKTLEAKQAANLRRARAAAAARFPGLPIELYYAAGGPEEPVCFGPIV